MNLMRAAQVNIIRAIRPTLSAKIIAACLVVGGAITIMTAVIILMRKVACLVIGIVPKVNFDARTGDAYEAAGDATVNITVRTRATKSIATLRAFLTNFSAQLPNSVSLRNGIAMVTQIALTVLTRKIAIGRVNLGNTHVAMVNAYLLCGIVTVWRIARTVRTKIQKNAVRWHANLVASVVKTTRAFRY